MEEKVESSWKAKESYRAGQRALSNVGQEKEIILEKVFGRETRRSSSQERIRLSGIRLPKNLKSRW